MRALNLVERDPKAANEQRVNLLDAQSPNPSVETLLHAFLPHTFVDHSHADSILVLANQPDAEALIVTAHGDIATAYLTGKGFGKPNHSRLGSRVVTLAGIANHADNRTDVHNAPESGFGHTPEQGFTQPKNRFQIGVQNLVPLLLFHSKQEIVSRDPGVVN